MSGLLGTKTSGVFFVCHVTLASGISINDVTIFAVSIFLDGKGKWLSLATVQ